MKSLIASTLLCTCLLAQTPAAKAPAKKAPAKQASGGSSALLNPAALRATAPAVYKAQFTTSKGDFVVEVHRDWAPTGADRFYNLVRNGFFTDASFFRVVPNFMVQFGISSSPKIAAAWANANIKDDPVKESNTRGRITYAMTGQPNSRSTQVFINFKNNAFLDAQRFAPFGEVVEGMDVVDKLYNGYGDMAEMGGRGPSPERIEREGSAYLIQNFPLLDRIKSAKILPAEPAAPAAEKK
jgi:peptidyl-prolyl cis-trans isomerase A (cyclophilin A)